MICHDVNSVAFMVRLWLINCAHMLNGAEIHESDPGASEGKKMIL